MMSSMTYRTGQKVYVEIIITIYREPPCRAGHAK